MIAVNMDIKNYCKNESCGYMSIYSVTCNFQCSHTGIIYTISSLKSHLLIRHRKMSIKACVYIFVVCVCVCMFPHIS